jgi:hypothetical protein
MEWDVASRLLRIRIKEVDEGPKYLSYRYEPFHDLVPGCGESDWLMAKGLKVLFRVPEQRAELMKSRHYCARRKFSCSRDVRFLFDPVYQFYSESED